MPALLQCTAHSESFWHALEHNWVLGLWGQRKAANLCSHCLRTGSWAGSVEDTPLRKDVRVSLDGFSRRKKGKDPSGVISRFLLIRRPDVRISCPTPYSSNLYLPRWKVTFLKLHSCHLWDSSERKAVYANIYRGNQEVRRRSPSFLMELLTHTAILPVISFVSLYLSFLANHEGWKWNSPRDTGNT